MHFSFLVQADRLFTIILFSSLFSFMLSASSEKELQAVEALAQSSPVLAISASILQAYPEVEKATIADVFSKAKGTDSEKAEVEKEKKEEEKVSIQESFYRYYTHEIAEPSQYERKKRAYAILSAAEKMHEKPWMSQSIISSAVWRDLNLFYGSVDYPTLFLGEILTQNQTRSEIGRAVFNGLIARPTDVVSLIKERQEIVAEFVHDESLFVEVDQLLAQYQAHEHMLTGIWGKEQLMQFIKSECYLQSPWKKLDGVVDACNKNALFMDVATGLAHLQSLLRKSAAISAVAFFSAWTLERAADGMWGKKMSDLPGLDRLSGSIGSLPAWGWLKQDKIKELRENGKGSVWDDLIWNTKLLPAALFLFMPSSAKAVTEVVGGAFATGSAAYNLPDQWNNFKVGKKYDDFFLRRMVRIMECLRVAQSFVTRIPKHVQEKLVFFNAIQHFFIHLPLENSAVADFIEMMDSDTFSKESLEEGKLNIFFRQGKMWAAFKLLEEIKPFLEPIISAIGEVDAYLTIAKILKNNPSHWSFAHFVESTEPSIALQGFWNPFLDPAIVVKNDLFLGKIYENAHIVITGPNSGGKSTALKALALSIVLGQSIGIAPASKVELTAFSHLALYMNISDSIVDKESRFQKEGRQAFAHGDLIRSMSDQQKLSFAIFDEIFSGTSPEEGAEWGYKTARGFAAYPNCICAIATHFKRLTQLEADTKGHFVNHKVSIATDAEGRYLKTEKGLLKRTYQIMPGIADQHIAKEVLSEQGIKSLFFQENF
jgi:hypothetical protein